MIQSQWVDVWNETLSGSIQLTNKGQRSIQNGKNVVKAVNPLWHKLRSECKEAGTPYSFTEVKELEGIPLSCSYTQGTVYDPKSSVDHSITDIKLYPSTFIVNLSTSQTKELDEAKNKALIKVYQELHRRVSSTNLLVFLGEIRKTRDMLVRPAAGLQDALKAFKAKRELLHNNYVEKVRGLQKWTRAKKAREKYLAKLNKERNEAIAKLWLEFNFGWMPLYSDLTQFTEDFVAVSSKGAHTKRIKKSSSRSIRLSPTSESLGFSNGGKAIGNCLPEVTRKVTYYVGVKYDAQPLGATPALNLLRRGGLDFSPTGLKPLGQETILAAWELTRWSFLIDYFVNVNEILEAVTTSTAGVYFVNIGTETRTVHSTFFATVANQNGLPDIISNKREESGGLTMFQKVDYSRVIGSLSIPDVTFSLPGIRQSINIAALAQLKFKAIPNLRI